MQNLFLNHTLHFKTHNDNLVLRKTSSLKNERMAHHFSNSKLMHCLLYKHTNKSLAILIGYINYYPPNQLKWTTVLNGSGKDAKPLPWKMNESHITFQNQTIVNVVSTQLNWLGFFNGCSLLCWVQGDIRENIAVLLLPPPT